MAKAVNSLEGNFQSTPVRPRLKRLDHGRGFQRATRCLKPKENLPIGAIPRNLRQIIVNRRADRIRQGELQRVARLALANAEASVSPLNVVECDDYDIAGTQAISCNEREDGVVALADGGVPVNGTEKAFDG